MVLQTQGLQLPAFPSLPGRGRACWESKSPTSGRPAGEGSWCPGWGGVSEEGLPVLASQVYQREAPWPSAQAEIRTISAYKTPRDKLQCVLRMCSTIMNLLSLANEDSVPGADDFVPVLVFVLIKVRRGGQGGWRVPPEGAWAWPVG